MKVAIAKEPGDITTDGSLLFEYPYDNTVFATINGNVVANICRQTDGWWYFYGEDDVLLAASDLREIADVVDRLNDAWTAQLEQCISKKQSEISVLKAVVGGV